MSRNPYQPKMERRWYLTTSAFRLYTLREGSSFFVGLWFLNLAWGAITLTLGQASWKSWVAFQAHPVVILFSLITLLLAIYNSKTWFSMTPRVMPKKMAGMTVNQKLVEAGHWAAFVVITIIVIAAAVWRIHS